MSCNLKNEVCGVRCTGYDGAHIWKKIHSAVEEIDCEECQHEGRKKINFIHDVVNLGLGKKAHDSENFTEVFKQVQCIYDKCKADGRC